MLWTPTPDPTLGSISEALLRLGARQWQIDIAGPIIEEAINRPAVPTTAPTAETSTVSAAQPVEGFTEQVTGG
jgi:hypothetical protein